ncbi:mandelate racemase [Candidatus Poribacteria bacterium]|nr:mandelate racemase [Candidatus Poribacteria bacterium]
MASTVIRSVRTRDARFALAPGEGADSVHSNPEYSYAVTELATDGPVIGVGLAFTLGGGNDLVCRAIESLSEPVVDAEIEELMARWGATYRRIANHPQLRWLGPHKGVVHLALASITNACFDLWAKSRGVPLWRLLLDLSPEAVVAALDLSYLDDAMPEADALSLLRSELPTRAKRESIIQRGYPGYDTSVGWFQYEDAEVRRRTQEAMDAGFTAMKLKVGSPDGSRDVRRARMIRDVAGPDARIMLDANQKWSLPEAVAICREFAAMNPYWVEEPMHPDDVLAHRALAEAVDPIPLALGEHVPNAVLFKNFLQAQAMRFTQVDCARVGGVSEFITVSLLSRKFGVPVVPHVGDMGQIHQHLVLFNHIALGHEALFLEYIPHLRKRFVHPADVRDGVYATPMESGSSSDLLDG